MNKVDIQLLFEYGRWANNRVLEAVSALTVEQFTRDMGGAFRSLRDMLHIVSGQWIWLQYWKSPNRDAILVTELRDRQAAVFNAEDFPTVAELKVR